MHHKLLTSSQLKLQNLIYKELDNSMIKLTQNEKKDMYLKLKKKEEEEKQKKEEDERKQKESV